MNSPLVAIVGPTASGKTRLALEVATRYHGEIICADSRTIYKGMDIGTAKPTFEEREAIPHHLLDVARPDQSFTVADFKKRASELIDDISQRGKLPILAGGTGLYIDAVLFNYAFGAKADPAQRRAFAAKTVEELQHICRENNIVLPENAKNKRHLVRAIELGGLIKTKNRLRPNTLVVGITITKEELFQRINDRAARMLEAGAVHEAKQLSKKYGWDTEAMKANIYRHLRPVVEGTEKDTDMVIADIVKSDMQLAKKQMTWFRRDPYIIWGTPNQLLLAIEHFVQQNLLDKSMPS